MITEIDTHTYNNFEKNVIPETDIVFLTSNISVSPGIQCYNNIYI